MMISCIHEDLSFGFMPKLNTMIGVQFGLWAEQKETQRLKSK